MKRTIPKGQIGWIVDRMHVSTTDDELAAEIRRRADPAKGWTEAKIKAAIRIAIAHHNKNRELYRFVMRGR